MWKDRLAWARLASTLVAGMVGGLAGSSCWLTNDCSHEGDPAPCAGPRTKQECIGGEGSYHLTAIACDPGQKCVDSHGRGGCVSVEFGSSCADRTACARFDCIEGICGQTTDARRAWCSQPTRLAKPVAQGGAFQSTFEGNIPPPPAIYAASLVPSSCRPPEGGIVLLSTEPPAGTSGSSQVFDVTIRAKTPQTAVYLRDCNPPATPIPCGTDQPVTERTSRSFEFMVASVRPNPAALPFALDVTWTAVTGP